MKLKVKFFDEKLFQKIFEDISHLDFSLFIDTIPESESELSGINIIVLQEPNEYFGMHDWVIKNKDLFSLILTWSDKVLNNCENAVLLHFGHTWFEPHQYNTDKEKTFEISHLRGNLLKTYGHSLRYELLDRQNEIKIPKKFYDTYGNRYDINDARLGKEIVFGNSMFGVAIENTQHNGYFTEKILDCFLQKTIPVYWGCSDIHNIFNKDAIIEFRSIDELISKVNNLDESYYLNRLDSINQNYNIALHYVNYEIRIYHKIKEIFILNDLIQ